MLSVGVVVFKINFFVNGFLDLVRVRVGGDLRVGKLVCALCFLMGGVSVGGSVIVRCLDCVDDLC